MPVSKRPQGPHWVTLTPLEPEIRDQLAVILKIAASLARHGDSARATLLRDAHDEIRRLLTESYPDEADNA